MDITNSDIVEYMNKVMPPFDGVLGEIQREALAAGVPIIPPEAARFVATLLSVVRPMNILEVGCAVGFSAGLMSGFLRPGGHLTTIDRFDVMIKKARQNFDKLDINHKVTLIEGNANDVLPLLTGPFDFIFLDAAKGQYIQIFPECMRLLSPGGVMLADDIMQEGRVAMDRLDIPKRQRTIHTRMNAFLQAVFDDERLESSIVPIGDGMLLSHKKHEEKD